MTNLSVLFYLKKRAGSKDSEVPVYMRITVAGQRAEIATGQSINPNIWHAGTGRARGTKEAIRSFKLQLDKLKLKINDTTRYLEDRGEEYLPRKSRTST